MLVIISALLMTSYFVFIALVTINFATGGFPSWRELLQLFKNVMSVKLFPRK